MKLVGNGIDYTTGARLFKPIEDTDFGSKIEERWKKREKSIRSITRATTFATTFRGRIERDRAVDLGDPKSAGWTFLVNKTDPQVAEYIEILRPLAEFRGMKNPEAPMTYADESMDQWFEWIQENYYWPYSSEMMNPPHYILIIGNPDKVPFHFQSFLDCVASVGRVDFNSLDDLKTYVDKIIRLENSEPIVSKEAVFFAPDGGEMDPTYFSRKYMAEPLADLVNTKLGFKTKKIMGNDATKDNLVNALSETNPALIYTASHGIGAVGASTTIQEMVNGAVCCQTAEEQLTDKDLFMASDVPAFQPFLEGSIFFQFACFGYGTQKESEYSFWFGEEPLVFASDFVAALPKRLLAHPKGPIAFIGHMDTALLHAFDDPNSPEIATRMHPRMSPFIRAVETLLKVQPVGLSMEDMNKRYDLGNATLTSTFDLLERGKIERTPQVMARLADTFLTRSDAQNYMVFGDPAARLNIA